MTPHHDHGDRHADAAATGDLAELLDLDAEVFGAYLDEVTDWVHQFAAGSPAGISPAGTVLDLGCGTGTATIALARRFATAEVIALDTSELMLSRVRARAAELGLADRVHTVQADLDTAWPAVDSLDVVWASRSLHHLAEPGRVLQQTFAAMNPGGVLAVAEIAAQSRFLPDDIGLGRPGLEARCHAVLAELQAEQLPNLGADWRSRLERAGFVVDAERTFAIDLKPPLPAAGPRYAAASLRRIRAHVQDRLDAEDLATLDALLGSDGPHSLLQRDDLHLRSTRDVYLTRRP
ncbi:MAG TPA: class I SAM-dependent methyltransferase [Jatrophihabitantaceae bacterium]|nr:class I SAM-dependent methyltransferase [Jatrophihabitantaceae bacterium]